MTRKTIIAAGFAILGAALAQAADPQPAPGGGGGAPPGDTRPADRPSFGRGGGGAMLGLDPQQRQLFQQALQKESDKLRELQTKIQEAQKELLKATLASDYNEAAVKEKAQAIGTLQAEVIVIRAKALASAAAGMKPEQRQQLLDSPFGAMLLNSGGVQGRPMGMGGGFGGGRGGPGGFAPEGREAPPKER